MIKMKVDELVFEMKEEMICYEQLGEEKAAQWERNFYLWLENKNIKNKNIIQKNGISFYCIEDESVIFDMADEYLEAVENGREDEYWKNFR